MEENMHLSVSLGDMHDQKIQSWLSRRTKWNPLYERILLVGAILIARWKWTTAQQDLASMSCKLKTD